MSTGMFDCGIAQGRNFKLRRAATRLPAERTISPTEKADCERMVSYITDDGTIAGYLGIDRRHVERIRKQAPRKSGRPRGDYFAERQGSGMDQLSRHRANAQAGSARLLAAIVKAVANGAAEVRG